ncbi:unnamed protein product [Arabidopsis lyrata]|uniref:Uncharacterized protein n=1 Tax=Arabidopsis lyrata subsp. lyrata TaxID=81972 RepID=D7LAB1_ARALL|nr:protein FAM133 [Arabidopsis lyrata subsp. lyrata]EFH60343.1 hypothetical protein ARALYDRAFT_480676 [Arabidopsis lyrata subsp. lyrata]CAH8262571.1 unnamed protein product [Arabidopsis lyrata]|eukprot:XP_020888351.1 protein FAM133 [Arabidopsis lyrata subsp. lyrata]
MSRCYPFPPPGYVRKESLIESIKGTKEEVKKDRKHKRKEKERKERENEAGRSRKHRHKRRRKDEGANASGSGKLINSEVEFLEKSCQTVELELQTSSQTSCDSTLHSNERPKQIQSQSLDETGIRIRLPDKGQEDPEDEVMMTTKDQRSREMLDASLAAAPKESVGHLYSTPRDAFRVCQEKVRDPAREKITKLGKEKKPIHPKDNRKISKEKKIPSSSSCTPLEQEKPSSSHQETIGSSKLLCRKCPPSMAGQLLNLIEDWAPDRAESKLTDSEDQEWWLFIKFGAKRQQVSNQKTNQGSSLMVWPTARFLPEAEVHALPFTVPF